MEFLQILKLQFDETPQAWGWFHILMVIMTVATTILFCALFRNAKDKTFRKILLICWIIVMALELYKELTFRHDWNFNDEGKLVSVEYNWYLFPFQFCSTPFYILPLIIWLPDGKVRRACMSYVSTFVMFAGLMIMIMPGDVYVPQIGICIQTMVQHCLQFVLGVYVTMYNREKLFKGFKEIVKYWYPGLIVFACMAGIAIVLNEVVFYSGVTNGGTFNMFFISRHFPCTLAILCDIYPLVPYPVFLVGYFIGFAIIGAIMMGLQMVFITIGHFFDNKAKAHAEKAA